MADTTESPSPTHLKTITSEHAFRWVPVTEALPPTKFSVLVIQRGDDCPAFAWMKYAAGDKTCPYFVCPQGAAMGPRNACHGEPNAGRTDVTHWWSPGVELPFAPDGYKDAPWGLASGWESWITAK